MFTHMSMQDERDGYRDAIAGKPRAIGGTRSGYRRGYDRGLGDVCRAIVAEREAREAREAMVAA